MHFFVFAITASNAMKQTVRLTVFFFSSFLLLPLFQGQASPQQSGPTLTVESIMRDPSWMGTSPDNPYWSEDGKTIYFTWRREEDKDDSLYAVKASGGTPRRVPVDERKHLPSRFGDYSRNRLKKVFARGGDIFLYDVRSGKETQLTNTIEAESQPSFVLNENAVVYESGRNLFLHILRDGSVRQVTNFVKDKPPAPPEKTDLQEYIAREAMSLSNVLRKRKEERENRKNFREALSPVQPKPYSLGQKNVLRMHLSPNGRFVTFVLAQSARNTKRTIIPEYVTESGFTEDISGRTKVGEPLSQYEFCVYDVEMDSVRSVKPDVLPGVMAKQENDSAETGKPKPRGISYDGPYWSDDGTKAFVQIFSQDNKDRWLVMLDASEAVFGPVLDHQHDDAWIGGPGIGFFGGNSVGWMPDSKQVYFQSEADGWSHLYVVGADGKGRRQLTKGAFEIYGPRISLDKKKWFFSSNEVHFGERHFYSMPLEGGKRTRITTMEGRNDVVLSPDESGLAIVHSFSNVMPELMTMNNKPAAPVVSLTDSPSAEFRSYPWRSPEVFRIKARDGAEIPARLYRPQKPNGAGVIFVHGAGYLQNAHKWWSSYFREYMFHNLLADKGYVVLDLDYRASAGLGRDWRTAIYRFMGGKDLDDQVDGARWLVREMNVDPKRIGIYGGSYGGFITLMALFTKPDVFAAGAALRPVTDWAHYNHGYTSAILNIPQEDTIAFRRSSPIYHAEGLKGRLLICHGMIDINVHFQDVVRLAQRLIELRKENWELAVYPLESHGFAEETSWMDEYKRILKLFEETLRVQQKG